LLLLLLRLLLAIAAACRLLLPQPLVQLSGGLRRPCPRRCLALRQAPQPVGLGLLQLLVAQAAQAVKQRGGCPQPLAQDEHLPLAVG
jgi:hypothetical protein